jgi:hypothetical protein
VLDARTRRFHQMERIKSRPWLIALLASLLTATLTIGGFAFAQTGDTFTGCLKSNGELAKVAIGTSPTQACSPSETEVSWNEQGPAGEDGATWFSGANLPDGSLGEDGDLFLLLGHDGAAEAGDVFVKQSGTWTTDATLRGPEGPEGPEGPQGPQGEPGARALRVDTYLENPPFTALPVGSYEPILQIVADGGGAWLLQLDYVYGFLGGGGFAPSSINQCRLVDGEGTEYYSAGFVGAGELSFVTHEAEVQPVVAVTTASTTFTFECQDQADGAVGTFIKDADLVGVLFSSDQYSP